METLHSGETINGSIISSALLTYQQNGWISFKNHDLLFWIDRDLQLYIPIANCTFVIGPRGILHIYDLPLYIGPTWGFLL